jgi:hypothetical protein
MTYITTYPQLVPVRLTQRGQHSIHYENVFMS